VDFVSDFEFHSFKAFQTFPRSEGGVCFGFRVSDLEFMKRLPAFLIHEVIAPLHGSFIWKDSLFARKSRMRFD